MILLITVAGLGALAPGCEAHTSTASLATAAPGGSFVSGLESRDDQRIDEESLRDDGLPPDPSDPTNIDARVGFGYKYTELGGASMNEVRGKVALDIGETGTFVADIGVGRLDGYPPDDDLGLTDGRFRYFHLWEMDRTVEKGYRGWGTSFEIQTQGTVPGTDGSNLLAVGALAAFGSGKKLSLFPNLIVSPIWSKDLDDYLGTALRGDLIFTYKPGRFWHGAYLKARPSLSYGMTDDIAGEASFHIEGSVGGAFTKAKEWWWDVQWRGFQQDDLVLESNPLVADWSLYLSITHFF